MANKYQDDYYRLKADKAKAVSHGVVGIVREAGDHTDIGNAHSRKDFHDTVVKAFETLAKL